MGLIWFLFICMLTCEDGLKGDGSGDIIYMGGKAFRYFVDGEGDCIDFSDSRNELRTDGIGLVVGWG